MVRKKLLLLAVHQEVAKEGPEKQHMHDAIMFEQSILLAKSIVELAKRNLIAKQGCYLSQIHLHKTTT